MCIRDRSYSTLDNTYGTVAEEEVTIDMNSDRWDFATEFTELGTVINLSLIHI